MIARLLLRIPPAARWELLIILSLMLGSVILFRSFPIDYQGILYFYHPELEDSWPVASEPLPRFLYQFATVLTVGMGIAGLWLFVSSWIGGRSLYHRWFGIFLVCSLLLGPAIVVNMIFKDNWERPRPRQTEDFGGPYRYHELLEKGSGNQGKSFPCGHCSVGFVFIAFWFWWRRRRPLLGTFSLLLTLLVGTALGYTRMAAGAHYPSDILWAFLFCWICCWLLYYPLFALFRIPDRGVRDETQPVPIWQKTVLYGGVTLSALGLIVSSLLATPYETGESGTWRLSDTPVALHIDNQGWWVEVRTDPLLPADQLQYQAQWRGHAFPGKSLNLEATQQDHTLLINLISRGWLTDIEGLLILTLPTNSPITYIEFSEPERVRPSES